MPAHRAAAFTCALLLVVAGCGDAPDRAETDAGHLGLAAVAVFGRHAAVRGKVDVRIANTGDDVVGGCPEFRGTSVSAR